MKQRTERFLTFFLDSYLCAFKVSDVKEINHPSDDFNADDIRAQLRDEAIPFFDLRPRLGLELKSTSKDSRLVVLRSHSGNRATLVDAIHTVVDLYADQWETVSENDSLPVTHESVFIGIASWNGQSVLLLDPLKIFDKTLERTIAS